MPPRAREAVEFMQTGLAIVKIRRLNDGLMWVRGRYKVQRRRVMCAERFAVAVAKIGVVRV
jgi:hypothetical protein